MDEKVANEVLCMLRRKGQKFLQQVVNHEKVPDTKELFDDFVEALELRFVEHLGVDCEILAAVRHPPSGALLVKMCVTFDDHVRRDLF